MDADTVAEIVLATEAVAKENVLVITALETADPINKCSISTKQ